MRKYLALLVGFALAIPAFQAKAGIIGSKHDFSGPSNTWNTRQGLCSPCHAAHGNDPANKIVPLWSHATASAAEFTPYSSPTGTMKATDGGQPPSGTSLACLSCHDGVTAVNQSYTGLSGSTAVLVTSGSGLIGTNLTTTHPISFTYDSALATADGFLNDPSTPMSTAVPGTLPGVGLTGKTLGQAMLINGKVECQSCHDVHADIGSAPTSGILVKISGNDTANIGSRICRTCHTK